MSGSLVYFIMLVINIYLLWDSSKVFRYEEDQLQKEYSKQMRLFPWGTFKKYKRNLKIIFSFYLFGLFLILTFWVLLM